VVDSPRPYKPNASLINAINASHTIMPVITSISFYNTNATTAAKPANPPTALTPTAVPLFELTVAAKPLDVVVTELVAYKTPPVTDGLPVSIINPSSVRLLSTNVLVLLPIAVTILLVFVLEGIVVWATTLCVLAGIVGEPVASSKDSVAAAAGVAAPKFARKDGVTVAVPA
jgi:hypothetical protein